MTFREENIKAQPLPYSCPKCGQNLPSVKGAWEVHVTMAHTKAC